MKRSAFLKILGILPLAPSVLMAKEKELVKVPTITNSTVNKAKRWPIYPECRASLYEDITELTGTSVFTYTLFTYVKINRSGNDYLIPLKETYTHLSKQKGDNETLLYERIHLNAKKIYDNYMVDENSIHYQAWVDGGFIVKFNPDIHHD
jgi:hypothetical protein